ncbi:MAG: putative esterase [Actinomycetia bacterium]|nr:putative esterase [Actinomycetes bacterium]
MDLVSNVIGGPNAERVLLLVHGYGADEQDLAGLLPYLDPEGHFATVLPRGPIAVSPGYGWYDIGGVTSQSGDAAPSGFLDAVDAVDELLDEQCEALGFPRSEAVVAGFSQGGAIAVALSLRNSGKDHPAALLAMSSYYPEMPGLEPDWAGVAGRPALVQHGSQDPLIPVKRGRELARTLQAHGMAVVYGEYPMGHQVALESVQQAHEWLDAVRAGEAPNEPVPDDPIERVPSVTTAQWDSEVLRSELPVIVDFWAPWCGPCRQVGPVVEQIAGMREGAYKVVKVNIDEEPALAQQYQVQSIPLIGLFRNGRLERQSLGAKPRPQLEAELGMLVIP